jgi:nucleotide-binding universal stress UspA family protein
VHLVQAEPAKAITETAAREKFDLIVMGTHGRSGLAHLALGSVAERVVRHAPCPVLTVPRPKT